MHIENDGFLTQLNCTSVSCYEPPIISQLAMTKHVRPTEKTLAVCNTFLHSRCFSLTLLLDWVSALIIIIIIIIVIISDAIDCNYWTNWTSYSAVLGDFRSEPRKRGSLLLIIIPPDKADLSKFYTDLINKNFTTH